MISCRNLLLVAAAISSAAGASSAPAAEALFKYKGKTYSGADLSPAAQQALYEQKEDAYVKLQGFVDQAILDLYFDELSATEKKPRQELEESAFHVNEPSTKEVSDWYEANKGKLPPGYKLEQISGDIKQLLKGEQKKKLREALVEKVKRDGAAATMAEEPTPPTVKIDTLGYPVKGDKDAKLTLVEFADYQCPHCRAAVDDIEKTLKKYAGKVNLIFIDYPINASGISKLVAEGSICAERQGKYWEYHDLAYAKQHDLKPDGATMLAKELKLDEKKFADCLALPDGKERVAKARAEGDRVGVTGTPTIFLNGKRVHSHDPADLSSAIDKALKGGQS